VNEVMLRDFLNKLLNEIGAAKGTNDPCMEVSVNREKNFAFAEFTHPDEATTVVQLDGVMLRGNSLRFGRPKDYVSPDDLNRSGIANPNKLFIGCIPYAVEDAQMRELLESFGELRTFALIKDVNGQSKGYAFCEYADPEITDIVIEGLNGMELGDKRLVVQRASQGAKMVESGGPILPMSLVTALSQNPVSPSNVLLLLNMVTAQDLIDDEEYEEIMHEIKEECDHFGTIKRIVVPRPSREDYVSGVGKVFVEFSSTEEAQNAAAILTGRKYNDRIVVTTFYPRDLFKSGKY
jgi:splicing factor U2AF subunit